MEREPLLPRPTLPIGAIGTGSDGRSYEILATIDRGGMGELFLARMDRPGLKPDFTVLKRLLADLLDDDKYVAMFRSEAEVMAALSHPNIVRVVDMPRIGGRQYLAMEYVRGRNVQQMLARCMELGTYMPPEIVLAIIIDVLRGLDYAHNFRLRDGTPLGLVHRDVTPGNVLVSYDGEVKLTDFGIAKSRMSVVSTTVGIVKGKARYLSPEQILGEAATPQSDVFAATAVICEMLTGVPAFDRGSVPKTLYAIVNGELPDLERTLPFRSPILVETIHRALAPKPEVRIKSARELSEALLAAARSLGPLASRADVGGYLTELFEGTEDPLADFFEEFEAETVHGFRPIEEEEPTHAIKEAKSTPLPSQIVRGTPVDPPRQAVDEALSVLAWLQSNSAPIPVPSLKELVEPREDVAATKIRPSAGWRLDRRAALLFGAGALAGVLATVSLQGLFEDAEPEDDDDELAAETPPPVEAPDPPSEPPPAALTVTLDILHPKGARARVNRNLLAGRVPIRGVRLPAGTHSVKVWKGKYKRYFELDAKDGEHYEMSTRLTKK